MTYQEAVDRVCFDCALDEGGNKCEICPVRQMITLKENPIFSDKKKNMEYWDDIEANIMSAVDKVSSLAASGGIIREDELIDITKKATEVIIEELQKCGLIYPYVKGDM